jgi:membrane protease YdiL (CAAX protease family)
MLRRAVAAAEVVLVVALVLAIIWVAKPSGNDTLDLTLRIVTVVVWIVSPIVHGDGARDMGLRLDNFWPAAKRVLPVTVVGSGALAAAGRLLGSAFRGDEFLLGFVYYCAWAFAQQYGLQAIILRRLVDAGIARRTPLVAAALFALVHAPNPALMVLTFFGAWIWCSVFLRHPNLIAVALSQACLATVLQAALPDAVTGRLRIGPAYRTPL